MLQQVLPWLGLAAVAAYLYVTQSMYDTYGRQRLKTATGAIYTGAEDQILTNRAQMQEEAMFGKSTERMDRDDRNTLSRAPLS